MIAVILAAGYATRLYPLTENTPKCLLPVGGRSILDILCAKLSKLKELEQVVIVTNDKFFGQLNDWKEKRGQSPFSHEKIQEKKGSVPFFRILNDGTRSNEARLGAIGDFGLAIREAKIRSDVLLLASDNLFDRGFEAFVAYARAQKEALTVAVHDLKKPSLAAKKYGVLEVDASGRVLNLEEKPEHPKTSLIGMGVYYFPGAILKWVHSYMSQKNSKDAPGYFAHWLLREIKIFSFLFEGLWYDIGDLKSLEEANRTFSAKDARLPDGQGPVSDG